MTRNVLEWLEHSSANHPDSVAFESEQDALTYAALLTRARQIGTYLSGITKPQTPVLILMDKSPACVAAMLSAVYAGCFYTPVDPAMPPARMRLIANTLKPACILCDEAYLPIAGELYGGAAVVSSGQIPLRIDANALSRIRHEHIDNDLLYVLFTSGSTGTPKGVAITHRSVVDFIEWAVHALGIDGQSKFGNQAPLYFDNSVLDIFCAMYTSGCVHFIPHKYFLFPSKMPEYLSEAKIDTLFWVPSALTGVARCDTLLASPPLCVRNVFFCGEVMPCRTLNVWRRALPDAKFVNMYGPTEITDVCAYYVVDREFTDDDALPIGKVCENARITLIDGEICVSGACLSPGYYNAPEKTAEAFVRNPCRAGVYEAMYRTGDIGRYNERGELMFLGRKDSQIKRHGNRIELGEIECALCALPGIDSGCCLFDAEREQIVCFYAGECEEKSIKRELRARLPKYMLPDVYRARATLPLTGNGKTDRVRLLKEWNDEHSVL